MTSTNNNNNIILTKIANNNNKENKFKKVNIKTIYLICGFIRMLKIKNRIIPSSIIDLLIKFYNSKFQIIYIAPESRNEPPTVCLFESETHTNRQFKVHLPSKSIKNDIKYLINEECGICYVTNLRLTHSKNPFFYFQTL